jgi:hypothetical protein
VPVRPPPLPPCYGLAVAVVTRAGSSAIARDTLSKRRPVVADLLNLSTLTGARAGMTNDPLSTKERKGERLPLEIEDARGEALLTSNWRIPASSS